MTSARRFVAFFLALWLACGAPAPAQSDTGQVTIAVKDLAAAPLADARVTLVGPTVISTLTTKSGTVVYTDVPVGIYRVRIGRTGFRGTTTREFEVLGDRSVHVDVTLEPSAGAPATFEPVPQSSGPPIIGKVTARNDVRISDHDISEDSPIRRLSDSMTDALSKLAGVSVTSPSNDPDAPVTISLNNKDESQTAVTLDGIPLSAPGVATNLRAINTDLFSGAGVSFSPSAGSLGGSVNFRTLQPTQTWQYKLAGSYGTYDRANYQLAATGSIGKLGIAVEHTWRGSNNPLTFQTYLDQSGFVYPHGGESTALGDFLKLRYSLGDRTVVNATALVSNNGTASLCTQWVATVPCGIGPNNVSFGRYTFVYGGLQSLIGNFTVGATAYVSSSAQNVDDGARYLDGVFDPVVTATTANTRGFVVNGSVASGRHTYTFTANDFSSLTNFVPTLDSQFVTTSTNGTASASYQLADTFKASDRIALSGRMSLANTTGLGTSVLGGAGVIWRPQTADTFNLSVALGSSQAASGTLFTFGNPTQARINCPAGTAVVAGPGETPSPQSAANYDLTYTHLFKNGSVTGDFYRQNQTGQTIGAEIAGPSEPAGFFPAGYLNAIAGVWSQPLVCGNQPFSLANVYVTQQITGTARYYQGFNLNGQWQIGRWVLALPNYSTNSAVLSAADPLLGGVQSTTIVGRQLPGRPVHTAGLTFDAYLPKSAFELLANGQWTGGNNNRNLGSYVVANFGLSHNVGRGRLTFFTTNFFNAYAGEFSTLTYAQPLATNGGTPLLVAANPLTPRQYTLTYQINIGGPPPSSPVAGRRRAGTGGGPGGPGGLGGPGGGGPGGGPGGPGGPGGLAGGPPVGPGPEGPGAPGPGGPGRFFVSPPPGADPLSVATTRPLCDAAAQALAKPILEGLRGWVAAYEGHQPLPDTAPFVNTPHPIASPKPGGPAYWIEIRTPRPPGPSPAPAVTPAPAARGGSPAPLTVVETPRPQTSPEGGPPRAGFANNPNARRFRAVAVCSYITPLSYDDAASKGIVMTTPTIGYAPGIGFFIVRPRELPAGGGSAGGR